ncbi:lysoplasmalogenase [Caulobacter sp. KR2-114]|uniref:lysoplasmalogenase n=1 Tax=Caulobacter sp. KR2-114 TaxID=3400912 RepID=UPI003C0C8E59
MDTAATAAGAAAPAVDLAPSHAPPFDPLAMHVGHANTPAGNLLLLAGFVFALTYGLAYFRRPASPVRTVVKTCAVAALAGVSVFNGSPWLLTLALVFCAIGDAFLAGDPKRWLPFGLASFLAGHLTYVALFVATLSQVRRQLAGISTPVELSPTPTRWAMMAGAVVIGVGMLAWLWRSLGALRWAVCAYVAAILAMVCSACALPRLFVGAPTGALLFFASDGVLSAQLFKQRFTGLAGQWVVWGCYFIGQVLIVMAFSPLTG